LSNIPKGIHDITDLKEDCPLVLYLNALKTKVKCNLLYIKIKRWFQNDSSKPFEYRFTGNESELLCHNFMYLIEAVANHPDATSRVCLKLHALAFLGLNFRDAVSLFSRQTLTPNYIVDLKKVCTLYLKCK
jgi:hypothetical protein